MHYKVEKKTIKTEYAAKSPSQANKNVLKWIDSLPYNSSVLDYGCGKFRYTIPLSSKVQNVTAVDSSYQVNRIQRINGISTNLSNYASQYLPNVNVFDIHSNAWENAKYDYILCSNVLSSIPMLEERVYITNKFSNLLKPEGLVLLCTQFRNSYFNTYDENPRAKRFYDGWIIKTTWGYSFYGLITSDKMVSICETGNLQIIDKYIDDGSAYVLAKTNR